MAADLTAQNFKGEKRMVDIGSIFVNKEFLQARDLRDAHDKKDFETLTATLAEAVMKKEDIDPVLIMDIPEGTNRAIDGQPVMAGLYLLEGHRRLDAYKAAGRSKIPAVVRIGSWEEAVDVAVSANIGHKAIPRKPQDKKKALLTSLANRFDLSNRWHAEHCEVSQELVAKTRPEAEKLVAMYAEKRPKTAETDGKAEEVRVDKRGRKQRVSSTKRKAAAAKAKAEKSPEIRWDQWESHYSWMIRFTDHVASLTDTASKAPGSAFQKAHAALSAHGKAVLQWRERLKK